MKSLVGRGGGGGGGGSPDRRGSILSQPRDLQIEREPRLEPDTSGASTFPFLFSFAVPSNVKKTNKQKKTIHSPDTPKEKGIPNRY